MTKPTKLRSTPRAEDTRRKIYDAALQLFREQGWAVLDVTDQAVEETAARIAEMVGPPAGPLASGDDVLPA